MDYPDNDDIYVPDSEIPPTYHGKPTKYHFPDGFNRASTGMKVVYIICCCLFAAVIPLIVPLFVELNASNAAKENADAARAEIIKETRAKEHPQQPTPSRGHARGLESQQETSHFRDLAALSNDRQMER